LTDKQTHLTLMGEKFIIAFHRVIHTTKIHSDNNQLLKENAYRFKNILSDMAGTGEFEVQVWRARIYFQGERLLHRRKALQLINEMIDYFSERKLQGLLFLSTAINVSLEELMVFTRLINESAVQKDPPSWLTTHLEKNNITWVEAIPEADEETSGFEFQKKEQARQVYKHTVSTLREVAEKVSKNSVAGVRKARRLAQSMVDLIMDEESLLLGLTTIREYDDYTYTHSVNVALLSMALGKHIGLSKGYIEQLGICGMFHDMGKVEVSKEILLKSGKLDNSEVSQMRKHPLIGVLRILKLNAPHDLKSRIVLGPFEHHLNFNLTGYPQLIYSSKQSLFGRILRITDSYDALTSHRAYRAREFVPSEALSLMWSKEGEDYDPLLLKVFINMMGLYPIGSVLKLDTGEVCLVKEYPDETERTRPLVLVLEADTERELTAVEVIDLSERDPETKHFLRNVVKSVHPSSIGLQPSEFFLRETG
jgi:HD-GYP domain-containing protein (c-di-GMP phosphodiesterase class II)